MRAKWRRLNARKKALLTLLTALATGGCAVIYFILLPAYPFTPEQALRQYEREHLYGPSEIVEEFPLVLPPERYREPGQTKVGVGGHAYLCRYEDIYSVAHLYPATGERFRWSVYSYSLFPVPEDDDPVAAKYQFYGFLHGTLRDREVTRLTVYGIYHAVESGAFYHTEEVAILPDGHFALALDGWAFICDDDNPLTLTGYGADGSVRFTADVYPPFKGFVLR